MSSDLRRPGDVPRPPDEPPSEPPDRSPRLRDLYVDDPDDIFGTTGTTADHQNTAERQDSTQHEDTEQQPANGTAEAHGVAPDGNHKTDAVDEPFDFDPRRAGLDAVTVDEAVAHIAAHKVDRPWLAAAEGHHPQVQRVYAALDKGQGHALPRHDDHGTDEMYQRRVQYLEDPAQLDDTKRAAGIDGCKPGNKPHFCSVEATRIHDPDAFAAAFAHGIEHPAVRAKLDHAYNPKKIPLAATVPIAELLGPGGYRLCSGFQLAGESPIQARIDRDSWLAGERREDLRPPVAEPIATFEGGHVEFRFRHNRTGDGYEISTMFPRPPEESVDEKESK